MRTCSIPRFSHSCVEGRAVDSVAVADQPGHVGVGADSLDDLLGGPRGIRMCRNVDVEDAAAFQRENEEHVQHLERHGRHGEEVDRDGAGEMGPQERSPCRRWRPPWGAGPFRHVLGDRVLADVVTELRELSGDASTAPRRVLTRHALDQLDDLRRKWRPTASPRLVRPEPGESTTMPR